MGNRYLDEHDKDLLIIAEFLYEGNLAGVREDLCEQLDSPRIYPKRRRIFEDDISRIDRLLEAR